MNTHFKILWLVLVAIAILATGNEANAQRRKKSSNTGPGTGLGNEVEGAVWQYTITRQVKGETEKLEGKFRVAGQAIFDLPMRKVKVAKEKRIGDIQPDKEETQLIFNNSDKLDGRAHITQDKKGIWTGYYVDKDKNRWKFEMRRGED